MTGRSGSWLLLVAEEALESFDGFLYALGGRSAPGFADVAGRFDRGNNDVSGNVFNDCGHNLVGAEAAFLGAEVVEFDVGHRDRHAGAASAEADAGIGEAKLFHRYLDRLAILGGCEGGGVFATAERRLNALEEVVDVTRDDLRLVVDLGRIDDDLVDDYMVAEQGKRRDVNVDLAEGAEGSLAPALGIADDKAGERAAAGEWGNGGTLENDAGLRELGGEVIDAGRDGGAEEELESDHGGDAESGEHAEDNEEGLHGGETEAWAVGAWRQAPQTRLSTRVACLCLPLPLMAQAYTEASIKTLSSLEHIRLRPGMYIGRLGNGTHAEDGIYVLIKETIDNCIDEFTMGAGKKIEVVLNERTVSIRDYGRGIPLGKLIDCVSIINTGAKYDSETFQKSVGLNGVGQKAVNALAFEYRAQAFRDGQTKLVEFSQGKLKKDHKTVKSEERTGTLVEFTPDEALFGKDFKFRLEFIEDMLWNYAFLNRGLTLTLNGKSFRSENGLKDLLQKNLSGEPLYPIVHLEGEDIEVAFTHGAHYGEEYYSFVNGQHTTMGGTHLAAFREALVDTIRNFFKKEYDAADIRQSIDAAVAVRVMEPVFESQTKTKLGSAAVGPSGPSLKEFIGKFMQQSLDVYLHKNKETAEVLKRKIEESELERKELAGIRGLARDRAKKASLHNKKLRDCRLHLGDKNPRAEESTLFIVEGDSAAGSLTATRDVQTQAVFALKGKPLNTYGLSKKVIYENEEFHLLQSALNIEEGLDGLRYNKVVIATDADVDGMHIRLLLISFFLQFFPDLIRNGHLFILDTPLFRVRNKKKTIYCYSEQEKQTAVTELGATHEITRFKGLGEISAGEFKDFIGENIRLDPLTLNHLHNSDELLTFFMGKNTPERQDFIIGNLRIEKDLVEV